MSYGMQIRTVNGLENIENLRSLREVFRVPLTGTSGSVAVPGGAVEGNSAVFFEVNDGNTPPQFSWSGSTINWSGWPYFTPTSNFTLIVCRFK